MKMNLAELAKAIDQSVDGAREVFKMKRGNKIDLVRLARESAACFQLLGRLANTQLVARAIARL